MAALTKPQWATLRYMARDDYVAGATGNPSITQTILADVGFCTISEVYGRPGFYAVRITDAGRAALSAAPGEAGK